MLTIAAFIYLKKQKDNVGHADMLTQKQGDREAKPKLYI